MEARPLAPGDVVAGKYRIESILGEGGMGYVLGARNITLDEPVAIKILKPDAAFDEEAVARFFREARASVRMKGEHVARVLDVGSLDDGTPYMLMELLEGIDLSTLVERQGFLPVQVAVDYVLQICEALAEAHALGIVHRDIKPSNLFLTTGVDGRPCLKVLDFGISKATNAIDATRPDFGMTQTQTVMGSPQYMAPEQMRSSRRVDGRTDIWGLGTIMHELLTGTPPFEAGSMPELFAMILQDSAPHLRAKRPDVPEGLDAIVQGCLEKSPDKRPANVVELAQLLMPFAGPLSAGAAERVSRVGRSVAFASASLIAVRTGESSASFLRPSALALAGVGPTLIAPVSAPGSAPSAPEMVHAHTTAANVDPRFRAAPSRLGRALAIAFAATLLIGGVTAAALILIPKLGRVAAGPSGAVSIASSPSVDMPPSTDLLPPPTTTPLLPGPVSITGAAASVSTTAAKRTADAGAPGHRPGAPAAASAAASARPAPTASAAPTAPQPATTASSRFD